MNAPSEKDRSSQICSVVVPGHGFRRRGCRVELEASVVPSWSRLTLQRIGGEEQFVAQSEVLFEGRPKIHETRLRRTPPR